MNQPNFQHGDVTGLIINAFYTVYNKLGYGFLEKVYENAMIIEMENLGLEVKRQYPISVFYNGKNIGLYYADLIINDCVIVELKAATQIASAHEAQLTNYLRATNNEVGLLLNFGQSAEFKRKVHSMAYKAADSYQERV